MSTFKKINNWLHLWLGLISGIIVLIVCITGCIWVFNEEITGMLEPETRVERQEKPVTLKELPRDKVYGTPFEEATFWSKLRRMNYDIHVGSILGFPGKVLAFLASLIGASLPVTGFLIWWGRKGFGKKKKGKSNKAAKKTDMTTDRELVAKPRPKFQPGAKNISV